MKLRTLAAVAFLALTTVAVHAQNQSQNQSQGNIGVYMNPVAIRISNVTPDQGNFAFLGDNSTSQVFYGYALGGFYDFYHTASGMAIGGDMRLSDLHANNAMLRSFLVGLRVSGHPFKRPIKPYAQFSAGLGTTKAPYSVARISKGDFALYGGVDYTLARHVDFRVFELGYGSLTTISSATQGNGGLLNVPASTQISFSSGLVFRF